MRRTQPSLIRDKIIRKRQDPPQWGPSYTPGQLATREEAPDYSRFHSIQSPWLNRRVHTMSTPEFHCFLLASWLNVFTDLHEGRMIHPERSAGFLIGYPDLLQTYTAAHSGSIASADKLGLVQYLPIISLGRKWVAFPLLADQLYFRKDDLGVFAVNWCIKGHVTDFLYPFSERGPVGRGKSEEQHQARLQIEFEVFRDAGIKNVQISDNDIPRHLSQNLRMMYPIVSRTHSLPRSLADEFVNTVIDRLPQRIPVIEIIKKFASSDGGLLYDYQTVFFQAVWNRKIRCDLTYPLQVDRPLKLAEQNIEERFSSWCERVSL